MARIKNHIPAWLRPKLGRAKDIVGRFLDSVIGRKPDIQNSWVITGEDNLKDILAKPLLSWINYHQREVHSKQCHWLGHRALKHPMDAWIYQEIIYETKPDIVIEIGNKSGGSTLFLAGICELIGHGEVLALDIDHSIFESPHPLIELITGDCSDDLVLTKVRERCKDKKVLVIHDADHTEDGVLRDLRNFAPLVNVGGYIIVEDSVAGLPGFSGDVNNPVGQFLMPRQNTPLQAISRFLKENSEFKVDKTRERYFLTQNYQGFLQRVS